MNTQTAIDFDPARQGRGVSARRVADPSFPPHAPLTMPKQVLTPRAGVWVSLWAALLGAPLRVRNRSLRHGPRRAG